jgi:hypothetical protein
VDYLEVGEGSQQVRDLMAKFSKTGKSFLEAAYSPFLKCRFDNGTTWAATEEIRASFVAELEKTRAVQHMLFDSVINNKLVQGEAITEGIKLMIAILSCIVGVAIVIVIQKRERGELLQVIEHRKVDVRCAPLSPKAAAAHDGHQNC